MVQCLDGLKELCVTVINCCDAHSSKHPKGLEDPEILARETVCIVPSFFIIFHACNIF